MFAIGLMRMRFRLLKICEEGKKVGEKQCRGEAELSRGEKRGIKPSF